MNFITERVLDAIAAERPDMADWCEDKGHELPDSGKIESLRWVANELDVQNQQIAARALGIQYSDFDALRRILEVI